MAVPLVLLAMQGAAAAPSHVEAYRACGAALVAEQAVARPDEPADVLARDATARCEHLLPAVIAELPEADTPEKQELVMADYRQRSVIDLTQRILARRNEKK